MKNARHYCHCIEENQGMKPKIVAAPKISLLKVEMLFFKVIFLLFLTQRASNSFCIQKPLQLNKNYFSSSYSSSQHIFSNNAQLDETQKELCDDMCQWLRENGAYLGNVQVRGEGEGYGLEASTDVSAGDILCELKRQSLVTYGDAEENRLSEVIQKIPSELWSAKLGLKLLSERVKTDSNYWPYIKHLPASFSGIPLFFLPEEVQALQYPPIQEQIKKRGMFLNHFSKDTLPEYTDAFSGLHIDLNVLGWAMAAVSSRAFRIDGESMPAAMLPLADMANHDFQLKNAQVFKSGSNIVLRATSSLKAGDTIWLSYGNYSNDYFLLDYGFVVHDNPYDYVELNFDPSMFWTAQIIAGVEDESSMDGEKVLQKWQLEKLEKLGLVGKGSQTSVRIFKDGVEGKFLAAARILCSESSKDAKKASLKDLKSAEFTINKTVESKTLRSLIGACMFALANFPTTIEQDEQLLRTPGLTKNMQIAINFRLGKKKLLFSAIENLSESLRNPSMGSTKKLKKSKENKNSNNKTATDKGFGK